VREMRVWKLSRERERDRLTAQLVCADTENSIMHVLNRISSKAGLRRSLCLRNAIRIAAPVIVLNSLLRCVQGIARVVVEGKTPVFHACA